MKLSPSCRYKRIDETSLDGCITSVWISKDLDDPNWDAFLRQTRLGQFQQSGMWAHAKRIEGWKPVRVVFTQNEEIAGGFQILERRSWWGKIGYVSKGPVVPPHNVALAAYAARILARVARRQWLWALVVQPPDLCEQLPDILREQDFLLNVLTKVNEATWVNDVGGSFEEVESRMSKTSRNQIRQAQTKGVKIREGGRGDVSKFFELMLCTCRRQGVKPNPRSLETALALWDAARPSGSFRIVLAEYEGRTLAAVACIVFGEVVSVWKKGWTSSDRDLHPNDLLMHEVFRFANLQGYRLVDSTAMDTDIARQILQGKPMSAVQKQTRDMFHVRFGGGPILLPEARIYFPRRFLRSAYAFACRPRLARANQRSQSRAQRAGGTR